jgi:hypothetical protein
MLRKSLNPITEDNLVLLAANGVHTTYSAESGGRIRVQKSRSFAAMKIADRERAPQAPWSAATWRRLQLVRYPVPRRRRAAALQGASRIFMQGGGPRAHDIFTQDDMPLGRCPQPPSQRKPFAMSLRSPVVRPSDLRFQDSGGGPAGSFCQFATRHFATTNWYERSQEVIENKAHRFSRKSQSQ